MNRHFGFALVLVSALALMACVLAPGCRKRDKSVNHYYFVVSDAAGLEKGAPVFIAGVRVGKIVRLSVTHDSQARIEIAVKRRHRIYSNASVTLKRVSAKGRRLELSPGRPLTPNVSDPTKAPLKHRLLTHGDRIVVVIDSHGE